MKFLASGLTIFINFSEQVPLITIGFLLWFIIPAAFVELPTSNVNSLSPWKQLKIYCAGVNTYQISLLHLSI